MNALRAKAIRTRKVARLSSDFEERIMFGDLEQLLADLARDGAPHALTHGIESLKYFRDFYNNRRPLMRSEDRGQLAAYDAAWCLELIEFAERESIAL